MAFKTRIIIILALLTFIVPVGNAIAADFHFVNFFADHRSYEDPGVRVDEYLVFPNVSTTDPSYNVYVQSVPGATGDEMLIPTPDWKYVYPQYNMFYKYFDESGGYPPPGPDWEGIDYLFYIDKNNNGWFDEYTDMSTTYSIIPGSIGEEPMDFVRNVTITGTYNPVITWVDVENTRANFYRIRLFAVVDDKPSFKTLYFNEQIPKGSGSYSYTYNGSLFYQYETLAIAIEAYEIEANGFFNRSRYVVIHNTDPLYTQEEVDQIVADSCPGNSEYHGKGEPPGQAKKKK